MTDLASKIAAACASLLLGVLAASCDGKSQTETETHFLSSCSASCPSGLTCVCGVCTEPCASDSACSRFPGSATCEAAAATCGGSAASACDVACTAPSDCRELGGAFTCVSGRCRVAATTDGGAGGSSGSGGSASGGASGGQGGVSTGGGGGGLTTGGGGNGGAGGASDGGACGDEGEPCCDPFPGDGPNYCNGSLRCNGNTCVDCDCQRGAYIPVCGADGTTYDATCGRVCVPAAIACNGECPCPAETPCPAAPPTNGPCTQNGQECFYESCSTYGRVRAVCSAGTWTVETGACNSSTCGQGPQCTTGQACLTLAGGALLIDCTPNNCDGLVECDCIQGCYPQCTLTSTLADGVSVYCNTCPQGNCP